MAAIGSARGRERRMKRRTASSVPWDAYGHENMNLTDNSKHFIRYCSHSIFLSPEHDTWLPKSVAILPRCHFARLYSSFNVT